MALSGSFGNTFTTGYRLQVDWSATQNITNNTTTVTTNLYLISLGSSYTINSSATKSGSQTIDGTATSFTTAGASLNGNQKKLIDTDSKTITHNADGTKSISMSASYGIEVTLGSNFYSTVTCSSGTITLDTIPRASTVSSSVNWTAGNDFTIAIARSSTTFTHTVEINVNNGTSFQLVKSITSVATSTSSAFSFANNETIFGHMAQGTSRSTRIVLKTYSGGTLIGTTQKDGTVSAPAASTISAPDFDIGNSQTCTLTESNSNFTHTLVFTFGTFTKTITKSTSLAPVFTFTSGDITTLYGQTSTANSKTGTVSVTTFFGNTQVRGSISDGFTAFVTNSNPTFGTGYTYKDSNTTTSTLTGNNQYIIQSYSTVLVEIPVASRATSNNGATMSSYQATLNGVTKTATWSSSAIVSFDFGVVNASTNSTLSLKAIDSRGNSTTTSKTITMVPYAKPVVTTTAKRANSFDIATTITLSGTISLIKIVTTDKNTIAATGAVQYRYKQTTDGAFPTSGTGAWADFAFTLTGAAYTATSVVPNLDNTKAWNVEVKVTDKLATTTVALVVPVGQPILFIDSVKKSVGVGAFPVNNNSLELNTGGTSASNGFFFNGTATSGKIWTGSGGVVLQSLGTANLHLGQNTSTDMVFYTDKIQVAKPIRMTETGDVSLTSTTHQFQTGLDTGVNIAMDSNEIQARNNGAGSSLVLNANGGLVSINGAEVVASGSNANGDYVKFYDGTMICWFIGTSTATSIGTAYGSLWQGARTWTLPATFFSAPIASCGQFKWGTGASWGLVNSTTTTTALMTVLDVSSRVTGTTVSLQHIAIGRWKA